MEFKMEQYRSTEKLSTRLNEPLVTSLGLGELRKAGLAEGRSVPHLQHTVSHHFCKHGGPELVERLALQVGVRCPLDQLLQVLPYHGSTLR